MMLFDIEAAKLASLPEVPVNPANKIHRQLAHIDNDLGKVGGVLDSMVAGTGVELSLLGVYKERINGLKMELFHASQTILALDRVDQGLTDHESTTQEEIFHVHKRICDLFNSVPKGPMSILILQRGIPKFLSD